MREVVAKAGVTILCRSNLELILYAVDAGALGSERAEKLGDHGAVKAGITNLEELPAFKGSDRF
jgi:hypothetical protein